jgi:tetratricopeptide (TPR) repeat protein
MRYPISLAQYKKLTKIIKIVGTMETDKDIKQLVELTRTKLQAGEHEDALKLALDAINFDPNHGPANFLYGVALRLNGDLQESVNQLSAFSKKHPNIPQGHYELGLANFRFGDVNKAVEELSRAVDLDPSMLVAWRVLAEAFMAQGDVEAAAKAHAQARLVKGVDPALKQATELFSKGKIGIAEGICREYLRINPTDVNAIRLLADIGYKLGIMEEAVKLYKRCLELTPDYHMARHKYALALSKQDKFEAAMAQVNILIDVDPHNIAYKTLHAAVTSSAGKFDEAHAIYEDIVTQVPDAVSILTSYGHSLRYSGKGSKAAEIYRRAITADLTHGDAYWSLANLKTVKFSSSEFKTMEQQLSKLESDSADKYHLAFALGKAYEDDMAFEQSFEKYKLGNEIKRRYSGYDREDNKLRVDDIINVCDRDFLAAISSGGNPDSSPIFVVGLPRSGSTLLEQILASHSQVEATAELHFISRIAAQLEGNRKRGEIRRYPKLLAELSEQQRFDLGQQYLDACSVYRVDSGCFIDKLPNNFMHIALIQTILPNAKIIDARRSPMAACFANFKQLFAEGQAFTYSFEDIGNYYADYLRLMNHWDVVMPGRCLTVSYESVVTDLETQVERILRHCGLVFEESCVTFYQNDRAVRSASSEQVRQPIFQGGLDQWCNYSQFLGPLEDVLKARGIDFTL